MMRVVALRLAMILNVPIRIAMLSKIMSIQEMILIIFLNVGLVPNLFKTVLLFNPKNCNIHELHQRKSPMSQIIPSIGSFVPFMKIFSKRI